MTYQHFAEELDSKAGAWGGPFELVIRRKNGEEIPQAAADLAKSRHYTLKTLDLDASILTRRPGLRWQDRWEPDAEWWAAEKARRLAAEKAESERQRLLGADGDDSYWY